MSIIRNDLTAGDRWSLHHQQSYARNSDHLIVPPLSEFRNTFPNLTSRFNHLDTLISRLKTKHGLLAIFGGELEFYLIHSKNRSHSKPFIDNQVEATDQRDNTNLYKIGKHSITTSQTTLGMSSDSLAGQSDQYAAHCSTSMLNTADHLAIYLKTEVKVEMGNNQYEIDLPVTNDIECFINAANYYRNRIVSYAKSQNKEAIFLPKPFKDDYGSSLHIHLNFLDVSINTNMGFCQSHYDPVTRKLFDARQIQVQHGSERLTTQQLCEPRKNSIAESLCDFPSGKSVSLECQGYASRLQCFKSRPDPFNAEFYANLLCNYMDQTMEYFLPNAESRMRLDHLYMAPTHNSWGGNNRSCMVRIPDSSPKRIEHRLCGADIDLTLPISAILSTIIYGIENPDTVRVFPKVYGNAFDPQYRLQQI